MGACIISGLVATTVLFILGNFSIVQSTPVFKEPNSAGEKNANDTGVIWSDPETPDILLKTFQNKEDSEQPNSDSENSDADINHNDDDEDDIEEDIDYEYEDEDNIYYNDTYYEYNYDYTNDNDTKHYSEPNDKHYLDFLNGDDFGDDEFDEDQDDEDDNEDLPFQHRHHLITGENGASIEVDDNGEVYMFLNVNETQDPSNFSLEVGNNTRLLVDLGQMDGNDTDDYEVVRGTIGKEEEEDEEKEKDTITNQSTLGESQDNASETATPEGSEEKTIVLLKADDTAGNESNDKNDNEMTPSGGAEEGNIGSKGDNEASVSTIMPRLPNDTDISVGWSSATISDEDTTVPPLDTTDQDVESRYWFSQTAQSDEVQELTTTASDDSEGSNGGLEEGDSAEEEGEDIQFILDMEDDQLKTFFDTHPDMIESNEEEFEANGTETEMATSALEHNGKRLVIDESSWSESSLKNKRGNSEVPDAESHLEWFQVPVSDSVGQTSVTNPQIDYGQIFKELIASNHLADEERHELLSLERLRRTTESFVRLGILKENQAAHHIVRRQLGGSEACGSFSRKRRDLGPNRNSNVIEGKRYKRGVANIGRRLEKGNPSFNQLYRQYKNMCNFLAMIAFEK